MQQIGEIAKNYAYKDKKGKEQHLKINAIPKDDKPVNFSDGYLRMTLNIDQKSLQVRNSA